ncbi:hypothetical protein Pcinc_036630 [Petrolisthes cinctipes]|uniref:Uncharacterized protein n=1 Tax=Petrolisthes cinctipes TaxID=88211 RepID=A0AAE1BY75_PETCI|nr:hypothetical protein Pcinc_036630 [Petrolisthes cinctipes]
MGWKREWEGGKRDWEGIYGGNGEAGWVYSSSDSLSLPPSLPDIHPSPELTLPPPPPFLRRTSPFLPPSDLHPSPVPSLTSPPLLLHLLLNRPYSESILDVSSSSSHPPSSSCPRRPPPPHTDQPTNHPTHHRLCRGIAGWLFYRRRRRSQATDKPLILANQALLSRSRTSCEKEHPGDEEGGSRRRGRKEDEIAIGTLWVG